MFNQNRIYAINDKNTKHLIYIGELLNNKYHGYGVLYNKNQNIQYAGYFIEGMYHGYGRIYNDNFQLIFDGLFMNNEYSNGKLYNLKFNPPFLEYEGEFVNNKYNGHGNLYFKGVLIYSGMFVNGLIANMVRLEFDGVNYSEKIPDE